MTTFYQRWKFFTNLGVSFCVILNTSDSFGMGVNNNIVTHFSKYSIQLHPPFITLRVLLVPFTLPYFFLIAVFLLSFLMDAG